MIGGKIIVRGDLAEDAGELMIRGKIYVAGGVEGLGKNAALVEARPEETEMANQLLRTYGIREADSYYKILPEERRPVYEPTERMDLKRLDLRYRVEFKYDLCIGCGTCSRICPQGVVVMVDHKPISAREAYCVGCQACTYYCPKEAVIVVPLPEYHKGWWSPWIEHLVDMAATGKIPVRGMGARNPRLPRLDDLLILPGQTSRPPIEGPAILGQS